MSFRQLPIDQNYSYIPSMTIKTLQCKPQKLRRPSQLEACGTNLVLSERHVFLGTSSQALSQISHVYFFWKNHDVIQEIAKKIPDKNG